MGLYARALEASGKPGATRWMALLSFSESCVFIIPPDIMLIPMYLARPDRAYRTAFICTVASILGGIVGYLIGLLLLHQVALPLIEFYDARAAYDRFHEMANSPAGVFLIAGKALTPIPYKVIAIAAGAAEMSLLLFVLASVLGRGMRFYALAWLARNYGNGMREVLSKHGGKLTMAFIAILIAGFIILPYL